MKHWKQAFIGFLVVIVFGFAFIACNNYQVVTVISKIPGGAYDPNNDPNEFHGDGWYFIGLSRNGKEPPEYIWRAIYDNPGYSIINTDIGDRGIISLDPRAKELKRKLPRPNAKNPPIIGALGEVRWTILE